MIKSKLTKKSKFPNITRKVLFPQVKVIDRLENGDWVYEIKSLKGKYKIKGYDISSGRFIFKRI